MLATLLGVFAPPAALQSTFRCGRRIPKDESVILSFVRRLTRNYGRTY
jgi:hypothetical protein